MNYKERFFELLPGRRQIIAALIAGAMIPFAATAQESEEAAEEEEKDLIVLTPFVIDEAATVGYQATQTLAGTRIASELKDVAASIFVFTPQLIEDTGITNVQEAFMYGANTEGRDSFTRGGEHQGPYSASGSNVQSNQRVRGLSDADVSRGYFNSGMQMDSFSIEQATLVRGPNSIMFGLGSPAGIFDYTPKQAKFRDFGEVSLRFDKYGGERHVLEINKELLEDELAVRVVGLYEDTRFMVEPAWEKDKRAYFNAVWRPGKGKWGTTVRLSGEVTDLIQLYPSDTPPVDGYRKWLDAGGEGWDPTLNKEITGQVFLGYEADGVTPILGDTVTENIRNLNGDPEQVDFPPSLGIGRGNIGGIVLVDNQCGQSRSTIDPNCDLAFASMTPGNAREGPRVNNVATRIGFTGTAGEFDGIRFHSVANFTDRSIFDWTKYNTATPGDGQNYRSNSIWNIAVEQKLFDNLHIEAAYNQERYASALNGTARRVKIHIDPNIVLPNGDPNPNYRRPVWSGGAIGLVNRDRSDEYRFTGTYNLDLEEKIGKWFGKHNLILHYNHLETNLKTYSTRDIQVSESPDYYDGPCQDGVGVVSVSSTGFGVQGSRNCAGNVGWDRTRRRGYGRLMYIGPPQSGTSDVRATGPVALYDHDGFGSSKGPLNNPKFNTNTNVNYFLNYTVDDMYEQGIAPPSTFLFHANAADPNDRRTGNAYCKRFTGQSAHGPSQDLWVDGAVVPAGDFAVTADRPGGNCEPIMTTDVDGNPIQAVDANGVPLWTQMTGRDFVHAGEWFTGGTSTQGYVAYNDAARGIARNVFESWSFVSQSHLFRKGSDSDDHFIVFTFGYRNDKVTSFNGPDTNSPDIAVPGTNLIDVSDENWNLHDTPLGEPLDEDSFAYGVVGHVLGKSDSKHQVSVYYNESSNFRSQGLRVNMYGEDLGPERGEGKDWGFNLNLFKGKINARINWFEVSVMGTSAPGPRFIAFWRLNHMEQRGLERLQELGREDEWPATPSGWPGRVSALGTTSEFFAEGNEIELTLNPWRNLRVLVNAGRQSTINNDIAPHMKRWIAERQGAFEQTSWWSREGKDGTGPQGQGLEFGSGVITHSRNLDEGCNFTANCTLQERWQAIVLDPLSQQLITQGRINPQQAEWHWSAVANYTFDQGFMDGFNFGGSIRWNDTQAIGYPLVTVPIDGVDTLTSDLDNPWFGDSDMFADLWFGYERPLFDGKVTWRIQMNIRNVGQDADLDPIATQPDGREAQYRIVPESSWFVTNSFRF